MRRSEVHSPSVASAESVAFDGSRYPIPDAGAREEAFARLEERAQAARAEGMRVVVVQGLGFVGAVMAAVVANSTLAGRPRYFVIGVDLPAPMAYWKVGMLLEGRAPVVSEDPAIQTYVDRAVRERGNLTAIADERAYGLADVVVVDVQLDVAGRVFETAAAVDLDMEPFKAAIRAVGRHLDPAALVLIETTVPPGTTTQVVVPVLEEEFTRRGLSEAPLVAHSYERVMPGRHYVRSIERFWRSFAGASPAAGDAAQAFLSTIVAVDEFPLQRLGDPTASELAKVLENSYRAANIAFIHEWTLAAEAVGVNLFEVIRGVAVRKGTHDNIMRPGFGVGGYCLTKDGYLAQWGVTQHFGVPVALGVTLQAMAINHAMPRHSFDLLAEAMPLRGRTILLAGISYLSDVADTRNSPSADFCQMLREAGANVLAHDPYVRHWAERPEVPHVSLDEGIARAEALVFAVRHQEYLTLDPRRLVGRPGMVVLDTQDIVDDRKAAELRAAGLRTIGVGKGHWRALDRSRPPS
jgi:UDP-N-acetyl-D-glucosamine dehydrogenase